MGDTGGDGKGVSGAHSENTRAVTGYSDAVPSRRHGSLRDRFDARWIGEPNSGCWLWCGGLSANGYGAIYAGGKQHGAHRVAYELHCGIIPVGMHVCHRCDVRACVNPDHLFLGTIRDNNADMMAKGRNRYVPLSGGANGCAKLTAADILAIRGRPSTQRETAREFGVARSLISRIRQRKSWSHIP